MQSINSQLGVLMGGEHASGCRVNQESPAQSNVSNQTYTDHETLKIDCVVMGASLDGCAHMNRREIYEYLSGLLWFAARIPNYFERVQAQQKLDAARQMNFWGRP